MFKYICNKITKDNALITGLTHVVFEIFINDKCLNEKCTKFEYYDQINKSTVFFGQHDKDEFNDIFYKSQFVYMTLNRFLHKIKLQKTKIVVDSDIFLNNLDVAHKNTLCINQNNGLYLFSCIDVIKIINNALTNATEYHFSEPQSIKNPYNNIVFTNAILYNIYFHITFNTHHNIDLFHLFFKANFDVDLFLTTHSYILRKHALRNFVYKGLSSYVHKEILLMLTDYNAKYKYRQGYTKIVVDHDFPRDTLIKIMRPYLMIDLLSAYSLMEIEQETSSYLLKHYLSEFCEFNPHFGEKTSSEIEPNKFDDRHIPFNKHSNMDIKTEPGFILSALVSSLYTFESFT